MKNKIIIITCCEECPYCEDKVETRPPEFFCKKLDRYKMSKELQPPGDCPLTDIMENAPEKIYITITAGGNGIEYIRKDIHSGIVSTTAKEAYSTGRKETKQEATKHIREVWKAHHQAIEDHWDRRDEFQPMLNMIFKDFIKAVKADLGEK